MPWLSHDLPGATAVGRVMWGSTASIIGARTSERFCSSEVCFWPGDFLDLSEISERAFQAFLRIHVKIEVATSTALTSELLTSSNFQRKNVIETPRENSAPAGPLIFTVPACGFVVVLCVDWLKRATGWAAADIAWNTKKTRISLWIPCA